MQLSYSTTTAKVIKVAASREKKILRLEDGRTIRTHRFACVGQGDSIIIRPDGQLKVLVEEREILVDPPYSSQVEAPVSRHTSISATISEITNVTKLDAYNALSQYHYKSHEGFGRKAVLVLSSDTEDWPSILGFIEIATPFMHLKCRNEVFDAPFSDPASGVNWQAWDQSTRSEHLHRIARISRVVVHPEVRGLGLSKLLLNAASSFCSERWHAGGKRPLFLEITADMLKYLPFASSAGFTYLGDSEGNTNRLVRDMKYLKKVASQPTEQRSHHTVVDGSGHGILSRQKRDLGVYSQLSEELGDESTVAEAISLALEGIFTDEDIVDRLLKIVRSPKPVYMKALNKRAAGFLIARANSIVDNRQNNGESPTFDRGLVKPLQIRDLSVVYAPVNVRTTSPDVIAVRRAFGLTKEYDFTTGINGLSFDIKPGQIALLFGASGSGKTSLLNAIRDGSTNSTVSGTVSSPENAVIGTLESKVPDGPIISQIGAKSTDHALRILGAVGLAEPRLYISTFDELSAGQKYRATLAKLICSEANIWLLDEFGSNLDDATLTALAKTFAGLARQASTIVVMASVRRQPLQDIIDPELVIRLNQIGNSTVVYKDDHASNILSN